MSFKSYLIKRYSSDRYSDHGNKEYPKNHIFREICKECGYKNGDHDGLNECPGEGNFKYKPDYKPIFFTEGLNTNIRVL